MKFTDLKMTFNYLTEFPAADCCEKKYPIRLVRISIPVLLVSRALKTAW